MQELKVGDSVEVNDPGLAMLRELMPDMPPNNLGTIAEIWDDGTILVEFPLDGENHSQVAPYPPEMVKFKEVDFANHSCFFRRYARGTQARPDVSRNHAL